MPTPSGLRRREHDEAMGAGSTVGLLPPVPAGLSFFLLGRMAQQGDRLTHFICHLPKPDLIRRASHSQVSYQVLSFFNALAKGS